MYYFFNGLAKLRNTELKKTRTKTKNTVVCKQN